MSEFTESFERYTEGLSAISTGLCPGCSECRETLDDFIPRENDCDPLPEGYGELWELPARPGVGYQSEGDAEVGASEAFDEAIMNGEVYDEGSFSWGGCDLCGTRLGGDRYVWHAINARGDLIHGDKACFDCVCFIANGDEPENWEN